MQVIQLIGSLFTKTLPIPSYGVADLWSTALTQERQLELLGLIHQLQLLYTNVWQDVEEPSRQYCSERGRALSMRVVCAYSVLVYDSRGMLGYLYNVHGNHSDISFGWFIGCNEDVGVFWRVGTFSHYWPKDRCQGFAWALIQSLTTVVSGDC